MGLSLTQSILRNISAEELTRTPLCYIYLIHSFLYKLDFVAGKTRNALFYMQLCVLLHPERESCTSFIACLLTFVTTFRTFCTSLSACVYKYITRNLAASRLLITYTIMWLYNTSVALLAAVEYVLKYMPTDTPFPSQVAMWTKSQRRTPPGLPGSVL